LPEFNSFLKQSHYVELFNRGTKPFEYSVETSVPWVKISGKNRRVEKQERIWIEVDWQTAPVGIHKIPITITSPMGRPMTVFAIIKNYESKGKNLFKGFVETDGYVSMEASHFTRAINQPPITWQLIPEIGRTGSGMSILPVSAERQKPGSASPRLEFNMLVFDTGRVQVQAYFSPTLNFNGQELQYAISFDDETPQIMNLHADHSNKSWENWVANNIIINSPEFHFKTPGKHILKYWLVDPGIVLQKLVIGFQKVRPSYLGPPESYRAVSSGARAH
jgi:hypothetical protein